MAAAADPLAGGGAAAPAEPDGAGTLAEGAGRLSRPPPGSQATRQIAKIAVLSRCSPEIR
jgi:hypothetical protein